MHRSNFRLNLDNNSAAIKCRFLQMKCIIFVCLKVLTSSIHVVPIGLHAYQCTSSRASNIKHRKRLSDAQHQTSCRISVDQSIPAVVSQIVESLKSAAELLQLIDLLYCGRRGDMRLMSRLVDNPPDYCRDDNSVKQRTDQTRSRCHIPCTRINARAHVEQKLCHHMIKIDEKLCRP